MQSGEDMVREIHECEICGTERTPKSSWVMAQVLVPTTKKPQRVIFFRWDPKKESSKRISHLCGSDCQSKFLLRITQNWT